MIEQQPSTIRLAAHHVPIRPGDHAIAVRVSGPEWGRRYTPRVYRAGARCADGAMMWEAVRGGPSLSAADRYLRLYDGLPIGPTSDASVVDACAEIARARGWRFVPGNLPPRSGTAWLWTARTSVRPPSALDGDVEHIVAGVAWHKSGTLLLYRRIRTSEGRRGGAIGRSWWKGWSVCCRDLESLLARVPDEHFDSALNALAAPVARSA